MVELSVKGEGVVLRGKFAAHLYSPLAYHARYGIMRGELWPTIERVDEVSQSSMVIEIDVKDSTRYLACVGDGYTYSVLLGCDSRCAGRTLNRQTRCTCKLREVIQLVKYTHKFVLVSRILTEWG